MMKKPSKIEILFEDKDIIVLSKPSGVFSIPDRYEKKAFNLYNYLKRKYGNIFTVHRLDKDTSGIMVFAKNANSHRELNRQFSENKVKKIYHIIIEGVLNKDELDIDIPIAPNPAKKGLSIPSARGKPSLTKLKVLERYRNSTFCECHLITGRHHQIRVHCSAIGFPLLVDEYYGNNKEFYLSGIKKKFNLKKNTIEKPIIDRITMHSFELSFMHPTERKTLNFRCEYPKDFSALIQVLRKYARIHDINSKYLDNQ
jgi:23S rRNA pseudouridine1911/1915/1917 synthase